MRKNSRNTEKQNKSVAPENKSSRKFFSGSFVRFSSFALLLLTALCVGVGFSSWNFTKPQGPTSISFSSVTASETEEYSFSVSSSMIDANTCFDAPAGDDIDETKLNGIISPVDGAEDLTFGIRLTFSPKSGDLTTDIISYIKGVNVAFGCSDATITDTTTQTSIRSWIENGYISLPGSASLLSSSYKFTPSIVSSNSVSVFSSTSVYDSTTTDIVTSHQWTKNNASDVTIRNCIISDGKNIVRAFSSDGLLIDNSILQDSGEFLLHLGSNNINGVDRTKTVDYYAGTGENRTHVNQSFDEYFDTPYDSGSDVICADKVYDDLLRSTDKTDTEKAYILEALEGTQDALDNTSGIVNSNGSINYDATVTVNDTSFSSSGIYSIAMDSMFNGGYLYNGYPSSIWDEFEQHGLSSFSEYILAPKEIGGTSYPVCLNLEGDTKFYDWKDLNSIDTTALINENISQLLKTLLTSMGMISSDTEFDLTIDDYFPIKAILEEQGEANNMLYAVDGVNYINTSVIWYGGGLNLSTVNNNITGTDNNFDSEVNLDMTSAYVYQQHIGESLPSGLPSLVTKAVGMISTAIACVTGSHDFRAIGDVVTEGETPSLYGKAPTLEDLQK